MSDESLLRLSGPVTVPCSARTADAACMLMRHLHVELHADRLLLPAPEIWSLLRIELILQ